MKYRTLGSSSLIAFSIWAQGCSSDQQLGRAADSSGTGGAFGTPADNGGAAFETAQSSVPYVTSPVVDDSAYQGLVSNTNEFGLDLFRALAPAENNLFFSPVSTAFALSMTYAGAAGNTLAEMKATLHNSLDDAVFHPAMNRLSLEISSHNVAPHQTPWGEMSVRLLLMNAAWAQRRYGFLPAYLDTLSGNYKSGVRLLDFSNSEPSRLIINQWVANQTLGKIQDLLPPGSIDSATTLVLTNTLYFYGSWAEPFDPKLTADSTFHTLAGADVSVPCMQRNGTFNYGEGTDYQMVDIPYDRENVVMTMLLPAAGQFEAVRSGINGAWLEQARASMTPATPVKLAFPKFRFVWGTKSFKVPLQRLGMKDAFTPAADFTGMEPAGELFVSDVFHQAFVAVDEHGTEAAAATAVVMTRSALPPEPKSFVVDRPFLFFIRDASKALLFVGQVGDPTLG